MQFIHQLINAWDRVPVLDGFLVQGSVINAQGVIVTPGEDQGHSGLTNAQECDRVEELLRVMQLL